MHFTHTKPGNKEMEYIFTKLRLLRLLCSSNTTPIISRQDTLSLLSNPSSQYLITETLTELELYINSYFGVAQEDIAAISSYFHLTTIKKGDYFLKPGQVCDKLSFHRSGIIRVYTTINDKEVTQWISTKGYFVTDLAGIMFRKASKYTIQAITDSELYTIGYDDYKNLGKVIPQWIELEKLFIARCFIYMEERILSLLSSSSEERYKWLFEQQRDLFNQVPLQYLASMLGMTPETFSRIRKKQVL
jgi:CRP/FNR family transcriptional regulator, anaerobic regulatory protein